MDNNDYEDENPNENDEEEVLENLKDGNNQSEPKNALKDKDTIALQKQPGTKQKRRSKNDCIGRDYVCGCGKTYLSYPALYTHIKTKHNGKTPEGTNANQVQSGRGRGRPRKNFLTNEDAQARRNRESNRKDTAFDEKNNELRDLLNKASYNNDTYKENECKYFEIYRSFGLLKQWKERELIRRKREGNSDNNDNDNSESEENQSSSNEEVEDDKSHEEINNKLNQGKYALGSGSGGIGISSGNNNRFGCINENYKVIDGFPKINIEMNENVGYLALYRKIENMLNSPDDIKNTLMEESKKDVTCDEAIAMFLIEKSKELTFDFFKTVVVLLKSYRDCMNRLGWEILAQYKTLNDERTSMEFCTVKDPSRMPEIANYFVKDYLPYALPNCDEYFAVVVISHFNFWLFGRNYTYINLKIAKDIAVTEIDDESEMVDNQSVVN